MVDTTAAGLELSMFESDGLYMVGEFLGFRQRDPRVVGARTVANVDVGIRMDAGVIETVQFGSMTYADDACGVVKVGDRIGLRVENRNGTKDGRAWQFYVGARGGASSGFADEFHG